VWLPWTYAVLIVAVLLAAMFTLRATGRWPKGVVPLRELALIFALYAVWQVATTLSFGQQTNADDAGLWLARLERTLHWPNEASWQHAILGHEWLMKASDLYYATVHVPVLLITLVWVFVWRRRNWAFARTSVALLTGMCLVIQYIPVAPPRLLPTLGLIDTAALDKLSVYSAVAGANQYAAMPSLHVGWAAAAALLIIVSTTTPWRWLAILYPLLTTWVVVVTGNHFLIDGVAAVVLLGIAVGITMLFPSQRPNQQEVGVDEAIRTEPLPQPSSQLGVQSETS
jgi:hypothetical protein